MIDRFSQYTMSLWAQMVSGNVFLKSVLAAIGAGIAWVLPNETLWNTTIACAALVALDTLTGIISAVRRGVPFSSEKFSGVLAKLIAYGSVVSVVSICGKFLPGLIDFRIPAIAAVLYLILATEGISILENTSKSGVDLPPGLVRWLKGKLSDEIDSLTDKEPHP